MNTFDTKPTSSSGLVNALHPEQAIAWPFLGPVARYERSINTLCISSILD